MTAKERLERIQITHCHSDDEETIDWLVNRVEQLTEALDLLEKYVIAIDLKYKEDFPMKITRKVLEE